MTQENHTQIYEKLGGLEKGMSFLVDDAKKKNGYITDLDGRITSVEKIIIEFKNAMEQIFKYNKEQSDERKARESFKGKLKADWLTYIVISLTSIVSFKFFPIAWTTIKTLLLT